MSLDNQIVELQNKKKQIAFLERVKDLIIKKANDDVLVPITEDLNKEIDLIINAIQTGERRPDEFEVFSEEEIKVLKSIAHKVLNPKNQKRTVKEPKAPDMEDKLSFHMSNRHVIGKKVKIGGTPGIVKGLDAPDAVVQMIDDKVIKVPLGSLEL